METFDKWGNKINEYRFTFLVDGKNVSVCYSGTLLSRAIKKTNKKFGSCELVTVEKKLSDGSFKIWKL